MSTTQFSALTQCYLESLNAVVTLQNTYLEAKAEKNIFQRYTQLRNMIKAVSGLWNTHQQLITSYNDLQVSQEERRWLPVSMLPAQCRTDSIPVFVQKSAQAILATATLDDDKLVLLLCLSHVSMWTHFGV